MTGSAAAGPDGAVPGRRLTGTCLAGCFRQAALRHPARIAVHGDDGITSYASLAAMAGGVAGALTRAGLRPGQRAGLLLDHGTPMIAAILGTLAAGGCYVPLDPSYPVPRLALMAADAAVTVLLARAEHASLAGALADRAAILDADEIGPGQLTVAGPDPHRPAYLLHTSGSTGRPKGVAQTHRNVLHGVRNHLHGFGIGPADKISLLSSFCFDMAVTDMFAAVLSGATLVPVDIRRRGLSHLVRALADRGTTILHTTPTVYQHLVTALDGGRLPSIRAVLLGGEQATRAHLRAARGHFAPDCVFVNGYGATEVSFAAQCRLGPGDDFDGDVVPIGRPLPGYDVLLLDEHGRVCPRRGEIAVKSSYLAPGYWNDPARTAERFTAGSDGIPVYHTGDQGALLPDGRLVCLGRTDRQVKVRGYRVELGEVEAHLAAQPGVAHAVAAAAPGGDQITGYVVPVPGTTLDPHALRRDLADLLPGYLMPAAIVALSELPLTPTGKIDVRALPAAAPRPGTAPATATERLIEAAWRELTGLPAVGADESFFDTGGHSLLLGQLQRRLEAELGRPVPLRGILEHATIRKLAAHLDSGLPGRDELDRVASRMARRGAARSGAARAGRAPR